MITKTCRFNNDKMLFFVFAVITALAIMGICFHEPWFDEAQAWLIARDASLKDILFVLPHYEGHPSLWHLILMIPARLGLPYLFSIRLIQIVFFELSLWMILFKSPFKRLTKVLIISGYFFAYQYCVISRPYALLMFLLFVCAKQYNERDQKPWRYCVTIVLICATHSYGIAFAGGLMIAELIRIMTGVHPKKLIDYYLMNKRIFLTHIVILIAAMVLICQIIPSSNAFAVNLTKVNGFFYSFILTLFLIPADCLFMSFVGDYSAMQCQNIPIRIVIAGFAISIIIWIFVVFVAYRRKMVIATILPYLCMCVLMAIYIYPHHFGIFYIYLIHSVWKLNSVKKITVDELFPERLKSSISIQRILSGLVCMLFLSLNMYFDVMCFYQDLTTDYDPSYRAAEWFKENKASPLSIMHVWDRYDSSINCAAGACINAYFDENMFYSLDQEKSYLTHVKYTDEDWKAYFKRLSKHVNPDFVIPSNQQTAVEQLEFLGINSNYSIAFSGAANRVYKAESIPSYIVVFKKNN